MKLIIFLIILVDHLNSETISQIENIVKKLNYPVNHYNHSLNTQEISVFYNYCIHEKILLQKFINF
jgi:hypothetical protein